MGPDSPRRTRTSPLRAQITAARSRVGKDASSSRQQLGNGARSTHWHGPRTSEAYLKQGGVNVLAVRYPLPANAIFSRFVGVAVLLLGEASCRAIRLLAADHH